MSSILTLASRTHSPTPSIIAVLYLKGPSIHMPGECTGREESRISILIRLIRKSHISFLFISRTWLYTYLKLLKE